MIFLAKKNGRTIKKFPPPLLVLLLNPGFEIRDPEWIKKNQDPG
jgi:hypothetical protein